MAMQIYSKLERALGSIHIPLLLRARIPPISVFLPLWGRPFPAVFALPGRSPAVSGMLGSPRKTANYTAENSELRRFVPADR